MLTAEQAKTLLDAISISIKNKPINSDKQKKQLINLLQTFRQKLSRLDEIKEQQLNCDLIFSFRFQLSIDETILNMLSKKRKGSLSNGTDGQPEAKQKKKKEISVNIEKIATLNDVVRPVSNEPVKDCREMPFRGLVASTK
jgi:hypothetical protein